MASQGTGNALSKADAENKKELRANAYFSAEKSGVYVLKFLPISSYSVFAL